MAPKDYDAVLLASFGGPEGQDDVIPFLRNVTRGRGIPDERLEEVSAPLPRQRRHQPHQPAEPRSSRPPSRPSSPRAASTCRCCGATATGTPTSRRRLQDIYDAGHRKVLMVTTSAYSCYSSCRQYREDIGVALTETGLDGRLEVDKVRQYFDHPGFVEPFIEGTAAGLADVRAQLAAAGTPDAPVHILFATHSIPTRDAEAAGRSEAEPREFEEGSRLRGPAPGHGRRGHRPGRSRVRPDRAVVPGLPVPLRRPACAVARTRHQRRHRGARRPGRQGHRRSCRWASSATTWRWSGTSTPKPWRPAATWDSPRPASRRPAPTGSS